MSHDHALKQIHDWWFPIDDNGPSQYADCEWGHPLRNAEMFPIIEELTASRDRIHAVDIGANIGYVTSWMSLRWNQVSSFEPGPITFRALEKNVRRDNIDLYNVGLSDCCATMLFAHNSTRPNLNQIVSDRSKLKKNWLLEEIKVQTLDSIEFKNIDLLKIDVEGHEFQVLQGGLQTIQFCRPVIVLEISYEGKILDKDLSCRHAESLTVLQDLGYKVAWQHKHDWILIPDGD